MPDPDEWDQCVDEIVDDPPEESKKPYRIQSEASLRALADATSTYTPPRALPSSIAACEKCLQSTSMPPLHAAAYQGHVECAQALMDHSPEYDRQHRTPLFYACAGNQADCCTLLLRRRRDWVDAIDSHGDNAVHVSCFFGWAKPLECVLQNGAKFHVSNGKGYYPAHLSKNPACLELLSSFGDDLMQGDSMGRSPLFIACARNRIECVEFLCRWNFQVHSYMLEQPDSRGDLPLHAAACNGSTSCIEASRCVDRHVTL